jgi:hypothetical protein
MNPSYTGSYGNMSSKFRPPSSRGEIRPSGYKKGRINQFGPEQEKLYNQLYGLIEPDSFLARLLGGDQSAFQQIEAPALRQFEQLQGQTASRFSGMGSTGARRTGGFQREMSSAASNFAEQLASNRLGLQRQALQDMGQFAEFLLGQRPYESAYFQKKPKGSSAGSWIDPLATGGGAITGGIFGGPAGTAYGASAGHAFGSTFR